MKTFVGGVVAATLALAAASAGAEVLVDFTRANPWKLWRGRSSDPAVAALQTRQDRDGTTFRLDATQTDEPTFASVGAGYSAGPELVGTGRVVRLVARESSFSPMRSKPGPGLLLTDRSGEHYQYLPVEVMRSGREVTFVYRPTEAGFLDRPWSGDGNGRWDPPMKITDFCLGYEGDSAQGDVVFVRLEADDTGVRVASREEILGCRTDKDIYRYQGGWVRYDSFPGPKPFRGPDEVYVRTEPALPGRVRLGLRNVHTREDLVFETEWKDESVFKTALASSETYEFVDFVFQSPGISQGAFAIKSVEGRFLQSKADACRLDVDTGSPLHIMPGDRMQSPVVTFRNPAERKIRWRGELVVSDFLGHSLRQPVDLSVAPGDTARVAIEGRLPAKGVWNVYADISAEDGSRACPSTRFAVLDPHPVTPHLADGKFRMGINYHYSRYSRVDRQLTLDALVASGAKLARADFASRAGVESSGAGARDWTRTDAGVDDFWRRGIALDAICWSQPRWAATTENRANADWRVWYLRMPENRELAAEYYTDLAARYGRRIAYYEIGNEWELSFPGPVEEAIEIQKLCHSALKKGDPSVTVIPNGWANWDSENHQVTAEKKGFPERMMREAKDFCDLHPIHNHGPFRNYRRQIVGRFLPRRAEMGLDSLPWYSNETALSSVHGNEMNVAEHVWMKIPFAWAYGSRDYVWYNLKATGWDPKDPEQGYGLITADYYPRAGYAAFSALTALLSGFDFREILKSDKSREVYRFAGDRGGVAETVVLGWDSALPTPRTIEFRTDAKSVFLVDVMGNSRMVPQADGVVQWPIARRPSALRFVGATRVEPDRAELDNVPDGDVRPIMAGRGSAKARLPDLEADTSFFVHGLFDANPATVHRTWKGPEDNSFQVWIGRSRGMLAFRVDVTDDVHHQPADETRKMSEGDCLRLDLETTGCRYELGFRLTQDGRSEPWVWSGSGVEAKDIRFTAERTEGKTVYKIALPLGRFGIDEGALVSGDVRVAFKTDDSDGEGRDLWMGMEETRPIIFDALPSKP